MYESSLFIWDRLSILWLERSALNRIYKVSKYRDEIPPTPRKNLLQDGSKDIYKFVARIYKLVYENFNKCVLSCALPRDYSMATVKNVRKYTLKVCGEEWILKIDLRHPSYINFSVLEQHVIDYIIINVGKWESQGHSMEKILREFLSRAQEKEGRFTDMDNIQMKNSLKIQDDTNEVFREYVKYKASCVVKHSKVPGNNLDSDSPITMRVK